MRGLRRPVATGVGMVLFLGGIVVFAAAIPLEEGTGLTLVFGSGVPWWISPAALLCGPVVAVLGAGVGVRYGNFERYHEDYDPETGEIASDHPFGTFSEWVSREDATRADPPEAFVPGRWLLAVVCTVPAAAAIGFLSQSGLFGETLLWLSVPVLLLASGAAFLVAELVAGETYDDYP